MSSVSKMAAFGTIKSSKNTSLLIWVIPLIAILILIWLGILKLDMAPAFAANIGFDIWMFGCTFLLVLLILILLLSIPSGRDQVSVSTAQKKKKVKKISDVTALTTAVTVEGLDSISSRTTTAPTSSATPSTAPDGTPGVVEFEVVGPVGGGERDVEAMEIADAEILEPNDVGSAAEQVEQSSGTFSGIPLAELGENAGKIKEVVEYPKNAGGGIYGDAYIYIGEGKLLKLRTLLVDELYLL